MRIKIKKTLHFKLPCTLQFLKGFYIVFFPQCEKNTKIRGSRVFFDSTQEPLKLR